MTRYDVVCLGETMVVLAPDPPGPLLTADLLRRGVGGAESNVAGYLARLGARTAWVSRLGADPFGALVHSTVAATGVDCLVATDPDRPTALYVKDPANGTVHYYRRGSAASALDRGVWATAPDTAYVHLSGITPALSRSCADLVRHGLADRPVAGARYSFDVNYRAALWPASTAGPVLADLAGLADVVLVGLDEAHALWGCADADAVRDRLPGPATLVVKDGPVGATSYSAAGRVFVPAPPVVVVEPVGAGDAFAAGYLFGRLRGAPEPAALLAGHRLAATALRTAADTGTAPAPIDLLGNASCE